MVITLQPGCWTEITLAYDQDINFRKSSFGQQVFVLPIDEEIDGASRCTKGNILRAFNASFEIMELEII